MWRIECNRGGRRRAVRSGCASGQGGYCWRRHGHGYTAREGLTEAAAVGVDLTSVAASGCDRGGSVDDWTVAQIVATWDDGIWRRCSGGDRWRIAGLGISIRSCKCLARTFCAAWGMTKATAICYDSCVGILVDDSSSLFVIGAWSHVCEVNLHCIVVHIS